MLFRSYSQYRFTARSYPNETLPGRTDTWVTANGYNPSGMANFGHNAPRAVVVAALKAVIDTSVSAREDSNIFNLIACPGYPELMSNMISLNSDRSKTAFVVGDTPLRLAATGTDLINWSTRVCNVSLSAVFPSV